jgi:hypothetical protein
MKIFVIIPLLFLLTGCQSAVKLIAPEYKLVKAPDDLYKCPTEKTFPKANTLTNQQVGSLILKLHKNNIICKNSLDSIKLFYDDAEKTLKE